MTVAIAQQDWTRLAAHCRALAGTTEDRKWGVHPVFSVGGKMYCILSDEPDAAERVSLAADAARFLELTDVPGISPAPYLARYQWISVEADTAIGIDALCDLADAAYWRVFNRLPASRRRAIEAG